VLPFLRRHAFTIEAVGVALAILALALSPGKP
jgi:hypothetical protein